MLGWFFALIVFFALGLALGAAVAWWLARQSRSGVSPAAEDADEASDAPQPVPAQGLYVRWDSDAEHDIRVHFHGRDYKRSWDLSDEARYEFQRYLHRLIRWFDHPGGETTTQAERAERSHRSSSRLSTAAVVGMYEEIDQVLQNLLQERGISRRVSLRYAADVMQLFIYVDAERYEHVDDIPDAEIRDLIREAARLWEQRR